MFQEKFSVTSASLELMNPGERGIVTACKTEDETILKKLMAMGVTPGALITLEKRFPSFVIKSGYTRLALDKEIARSIYVRIND
ncbi:MAG: FeoA family protein [Nostocaceae cyanobacterium]|nr:FeoA family protein [Nostocaceae cyanobacterium]